MPKSFGPTIRLTTGLVSLSVSLFLVAWTAGIVPDNHAAQVRARGDYCEVLAITVSRMASMQDFGSIEACLRSIAERNGDIQSIAVWKQSGELLVRVGDDNRVDEASSEVTSTESSVVVPIYSGSVPWGRSVVRFQPIAAGWLPPTFRSPFLLLLAFVTLGQFIAYPFYLRRVFVYLNPSRVVPGRVRSALDSLAEGLLLADREGRIVLANRAFSETTERTPDDLIGCNVGRLAWVNPEKPVADPKGFVPEWLQTLADGKSRNGEIVGFRNAAGQVRSFVVNVTAIHDDRGQQQGLLASFQDITLLEERTTELQSAVVRLQDSAEQIRAQNRQLEYMATRDGLTGCWNRRWFLERFDELWSEATHRQLSLCCVMVDVDHFKKINDGHGHLVGDQVLLQVAACLQKHARTDDVVARYGGEEFAILLPMTELTEAVQQGDVLRRAIEELNVDGVRVTASLGVSAIGLKAESPQHLLDQADKCLYAAKRGGRNQVVRFDRLPSEPSPPEKCSPESNGAAGRIPYRSVMALSTALAYRHSGTAEHSRRVADYCVKAAKGFLSHSRCYVLEIAALLHDIGKIGVSETLLNKRNTLTPEEWETIRRHDRIGVEIVTTAFSDPSLTAIIESHSIHFASLPSEAPLEARILAVADAYDIMVTGGGYRSPRTPREAFEELRRHAGTQFDPEVVKAFIGRITDEMRQEVGLDELALMSQETSLDLGRQIERMMTALDQSDMRGFANLAGELKTSAASRGVVLMASKASDLEQLARDDEGLLEILKLSKELMELCRESQRESCPIRQSSNLTFDEA
jgi:diguanylate cyclase (GGDEF)-like protein/PAS domain S-box-containing protein/putative nucleotidyltransferase with HDIG domain